MNLADTLLLNKERDEALSYYKKLAEIFAADGFLSKAIALYKKMLRVRPDDPEITKLLSNLSETLATKEISSAPVSPKTATEKAEESPRMEFESLLLKDLTPQEFDEVVRSLKLRHFEEDTLVVKEGDPGNSMFVIVQGEVRVLTRDTPKGKEIRLADLGEGEFFGEVSLLTGKPRTATILTNTMTEMLEFERKDFEKITEQFPHVKKVLEEFHVQRAYRTVEAMIQALRNKRKGPDEET